MNKTKKVTAVVALLSIALSAVFIVFAGSKSGFKTNYDQQEKMNMQNIPSLIEDYFDSDCTMPSCQMAIRPGQLKKFMEQMPYNGRQLIRILLQNASASTVQGKIVTEFRGMLILDTGSGQVRVLMPKDWSMNNEVVNRNTLFNGTFASPGQDITLKVLESDVFRNASFTISIMIGYEAINATSTHASAVLPFNIQTP